MGFSGGGSNVLKPHKHSSAVQDGSPLNMNNVTEATLTAGDIVYSDGAALQRLPIGSTADSLVVSAGAPSWGAATSNPLIKVTKTFADIVIAGTSMDIYTLPQDAALVNVYTDITTVFDVSTGVTIGDAGDDNGFVEASDWTAGLGLTAATRGAYVTTFKTMRSTSGTTAIKAYNFSTAGGSGTPFVQSNTNTSQDLFSTTVSSEMCQLYQAGQVLIGQEVCKASWFIQDSGGTATGDLKAYIRTSAGVLVATSTTVLDASTVTGSFVEYTFDFPATTMVADYMICLSSADMTAGQVAVQSYTTNISNGLFYMLESGSYTAVNPRSTTGTVTYGCSPLTTDTQGVVDFYLQVVD
jgi:hypothetical protein